jgi:hypothetical protein
MERSMLVIGIVSLALGITTDLFAVRRYKKIEPIIIEKEATVEAMKEIGSFCPNSKTRSLDIVRGLLPTLSDLVGIIDNLDTKVESYFGICSAQDVALFSARDLLSTSTVRLNSIIDSLNTRLVLTTNLLGTSTVALNSAITGLSASTAASLGSVSTSTVRLGSLVDSLSTSMATNSSSVATSTTALSSTVVGLSATVGAVSAGLTTLEERVGLVEGQGPSQSDSLLLALLALGSVTDELDGRITQGQAELATIVSQLDGKIASQADGLDTQLGQLNTAINIVDEKIDTLNSRLASEDDMLLLDLIELNSAVDALDAKIVTRSMSLSDEFDLRCLELENAAISIGEQSRKCCQENEEALESCAQLVARHAGQIQDFESYTGSAVTILIMEDQVLTQDMLPVQGETKIIRFAPVPQNSDHQLATLTIDPSLLDGDGRIVLNPGSKLKFSGQGIVVLQDGVLFELRGNCRFDQDVVLGEQNNSADLACPELVFEGRVTVYVVPGATIKCAGSGSGSVRIRRGAQFIVNQASQVILGDDEGSILNLFFDDNSSLVLDNPDALLSFQQATFNIMFDRNSTCDIVQGVCEFNSNRGVYAPGFVQKIQFKGGSILNVHRVGDYAGCVAMAPNKDNSTVCFDNIGSFVNGKGDIRYRSFDKQGVDSTLEIQGSSGALQGSMGQLWMALAAHDVGAIAVRLGTLSGDICGRAGQTVCGQAGNLAALTPERSILPGEEQRSGRIIKLQPGDSHLFYDVSVCGGALNVISGVDASGTVFRLHCK